MKTVDDLLREIYNTYLLEAEKKYNDPDLYNRFAAERRERYERSLNSFSDEKKRDAYYAMTLKDEYFSLGKLQTVDSLYYKFTEDKNYSQIQCLAWDIYDFAMAKYDGAEPSAEQLEEAEQKLRKIEELKDQVVDFYKKRAANLFSEAIVEYNYAAGFSPHYSLRMADRLRYR